MYLSSRQSIKLNVVPFFALVSDGAAQCLADGTRPVNECVLEFVRQWEFVEGLFHGAVEQRVENRQKSSSMKRFWFRGFNGLTQQFAHTSSNKRTRDQLTWLVVHR